MSCTQNITNLSTFCKTTSNSSSFSLVPEPEALRIFRIVVFGLIAAFALVGNFVVCLAVWKSPGPKVAFAHYLVSNLAFAEIVSMICLVFTFHAYEPPYSWRLGRLMCKILEPLQISSLLVVTTTLAIFAVYRCVLLIKSVVTKPTRRQTWCAILITWVGSVGLSLPTGHFRVVNSYGDDCDVHYCEEVFPEEIQHHQNTYSIVLFIVNFVLPLVIMAISYFLVTRKIREHIRLIKRLKDEQNKALSSVTRYSVCVEESQMGQRASVVGKTPAENQEEVELKAITSNGSSGSHNGKGKTSSRDREKEVEYVNLVEQDEKKDTIENAAVEHQPTQGKKGAAFELENDLLRMVYALVLIFLICYIPFQIQFLLIEFKAEFFILWPHKYTFTRIVFTLTCLPSALHPICYGMMSKFYRRAFLRIIACRKFRE